MYVAVIKLLGDRFTICLMCSSSYSDPVSALILELTDVFAVIVIAMLLKQLTDEWITNISLSSSVYIGQHTMGIFLLHKPMMQQLFLPCMRNHIGQFCPESVIRFMGVDRATGYIVAVQADRTLCPRTGRHIQSRYRQRAKRIISSGHNTTDEQPEVKCS